MPTYQSNPPYEHGQSEALGVLLVNLGTPDAPTTTAVRSYLAEFLRDPRVVEIPRPIWWLILHGFILRFRPARSSRAYRKIWTDLGSPLLVHSRDIASGVTERLQHQYPGKLKVALGMSYGNPSIEVALDELHAAGARRILLLPLYPQYSGTTTASVFDAVTSVLGRRRWVPELRTIHDYHDAPDYVAALTSSIREHWERQGRGDKLLFSFHGIPMQTLLDGDPYHCQCLKTARLVAEALELGPDDWTLSFQSRVGRAEWLRPYTDETIAELASAGLQSLDVVCPGFSADCLETLEEIAIQNAEAFAAAGDGKLTYIPALNARDDHLAFLAQLIKTHISGWPEASSNSNDGTLERSRSRKRALAVGAER